MISLPACRSSLDTSRIRVQIPRPPGIKEFMVRKNIKIERVTQIDQALLDGINRLLPQLSEQAIIISSDDLAEILNAACSDLFVAVAPESGQLVGMLVLVHFRIPTGVRAWIEDVVVDTQARGSGVARALLDAAIDQAKLLRAKTLDLTSNPQRTAAHKLYETSGFNLRESRVYRFGP